MTFIAIIYIICDWTLKKKFNIKIIKIKIILIIF